MSDRAAQTGEPLKLWEPDAATIARANLSRTMARLGLATYEQLYAWSIRDREAFWSDVIDTLAIRYERPPTRVLDAGDDPRQVRWLPGARLNIAASCFQADMAAAAIVSREPGGALEVMSYGGLRRMANRVACGLQRMGIEPGDGVAVFMPMTARSVAIYLGIVLAGCSVVSIAESFAAEQVHMRFRIGAAKVVFTALHFQRGSKKLEVYQRACQAQAPRAIVVGADTRPDALGLRHGDLGWNEFIGGTSESDVLVPQEPDATTNVLFSSGTTGVPKAIPWDHTTPIKAASDAHYHHDLHPGDVVAWPTSLGWMMGPWLVFATLINRGTVALFDGSPLEAEFGRFVQEARVTVLGVVPSLVRQWRSSAALEQYDWSHLRLFSSTGECSNPDDMAYLSRLAGGKPIIEYCGGTEIGGAYLTSTIVQSNHACVFTTAALGSALVIVDADHRPALRGEAMLIPPCMGLSQRLVAGDHHEVYHDSLPHGPGGQVLRRHGDFVERLPEGYRVLGRTDDTMNLGGIKVAAAEIERVLMESLDLVDVAAIGVASPGGGPEELVICLADRDRDASWLAQRQAQMQETLRNRLNPLFKINRVICLEQLPRTSSNKILRRELRSLCMSAKPSHHGGPSG